MSVQVARPKTKAGIKALIRQRDRHIAALEEALAVKGLPVQDRKHLQQRLHGERMNRQSWLDYLAKKESKAA